MAYYQGYGANVPRGYGNAGGQYGGEYDGGVPVYGNEMGQYTAGDASTYQYTNGEYMHSGQFSEFSTGTMHMGNLAYPRQETVVYGKKQYIVERVLVEAANDPMRMSNGLRVITDPTMEMQLVEKKLTIINDFAATRAKAEINALKQIRDAGGSPNINAIHDAFWSGGSKNCALLLEYCDQDTVQEMIVRGQQSGAFIPESQCWHVLEGMLKALTMCHFGTRNPDAESYKYHKWNTICHLDIKPANVFLTTSMIPGQETFENRVVLGDFGCAVTRIDVEAGRHDRHNLPGGTHGWTPPEITRGNDGRWTGQFGKPVDIWQTGALIQAMCLLSPVPDITLLPGGRPCGPEYSIELNVVVAAAMEKNFRKRGSALNLWKMLKQSKEDWLRSQQ